MVDLHDLYINVQNAGKALDLAQGAKEIAAAAEKLASESSALAQAANTYLASLDTPE